MLHNEIKRYNIFSSSTGILKKALYIYKPFEKYFTKTPNIDAFCWTNKYSTIIYILNIT